MDDQKLLPHQQAVSNISTSTAWPWEHGDGSQQMRVSMIRSLMAEQNGVGYWQEASLCKLPFSSDNQQFAKKRGNRMGIEIRLLTSEDSDVLDHVAEDVFDNCIDSRLCAEFLEEPRHHLAVAINEGIVIGMASAVDYIHPDKPVELWINEVGVSPDYKRIGVGRRLVQALLGKAAELGCREVWVAAEGGDKDSQKFYSSLGGEPDPLVMYTFEIEGMPS